MTDLIEQLKSRADTMNGVTMAGASDGCGTYAVGYYGMVDRNLDREAIEEIASLRTALAIAESQRDAAISQLQSTGDVARDLLERAENSESALATERERAEKAEENSAAARQNFHTMQLAADALRKRAEKAEASLAEAKRLLAGLIADRSLGCNAGCHELCGCSVPVNVCAVCKDCDYGDNAEADQIRARCIETYGPFEDDASPTLLQSTEGQ